MVAIPVFVVAAVSAVPRKTASKNHAVDSFLPVLITLVQVTNTAIIPKTRCAVLPIRRAFVKSNQKVVPNITHLFVDATEKPTKMNVPPTLRELLPPRSALAKLRNLAATKAIATKKARNSVEMEASASVSREMLLAWMCLVLSASTTEKRTTKAREFQQKTVVILVSVKMDKSPLAQRQSVPSNLAAALQGFVVPKESIARSKKAADLTMERAFVLPNRKAVT